MFDKVLKRLTYIFIYPSEAFLSDSFVTTSQTSL